MIVPQKTLYIFTFSPRSDYSSHSSLCSERSPIHLHPSAAELTNGTAFFFLRRSIAEDQRDRLPSVLWLGVLLCPIPHSPFYFLWLDPMTNTNEVFTALDSHAILAASFPGFFLATCSLFQTSFLKQTSNWNSTSVLPILSAILCLEARLNYFCI